MVFAINLCGIRGMKSLYRHYFLLGAFVALPYLSAEQATLADAETQVEAQAPATASAKVPALPIHQLFFSPQDHVDDQLISLIENEKDEIRVAVYCLTHRGIIKALMGARKRGVHVELIVDPFTIKARAPLKRMAQSGIDIYVWNPEPAKPLRTSMVKEKEKEKDKDKQEKVRRPLMHNKFCVFGKALVWTGSFNFTSEASQANQENVVVLRDADAGQRYVAEFERVKSEGCSPFRVFLSQEAGKKKKAKLY